MKQFLLGWFYGNLTLTHYAVLAAIVAVIAIGIIDGNAADERVDTFVRSR